MIRVLLLLTALFSLHLKSSASNVSPVILGAERIKTYAPILEGKKVGLYSNHTGIVNGLHTLDRLINNNINVTTLFSPEHGFRGVADAGELVSSSVDKKTGIPIVSLYGSKKLDTALFKDLDVLVVDIQDVGLRFYTYYITMIKLMEACAEYDTTVLILDRPNPNGHYVDGPTLDMKHKSGVGYLPIPVVHGMTLGELALMINGEGWLKEGKKCHVKVITCLNYEHQTRYQVDVAPSPNLPNMRSIYLYPSICLFEGTPISLGRGTDKPFQVYGHPKLKSTYSFSFTPQSLPGAKNPPLLNKLCYGVDLTTLDINKLPELGLDLSFLIDAYNNSQLGKQFFTNFFPKLIGVDYVSKMIIDGKTAEEIKLVWQEDVENFKKQRKPYLLYKD